VPTLTKPSQTHHGDIIIVDDNLANLKLLEEMLVQQGHEVRSFPLGRLALAAAIRNPPDLILLDVNMPEMNGYEVCERLKSTEELSEVLVQLRLWNESRRVFSPRFIRINKLQRLLGVLAEQDLSRRHRSSRHGCYLRVLRDPIHPNNITQCRLQPEG